MKGTGFAPAPSPLVDVLECIPAEGRAVLEDVIERVQSAELPPLLLVVDGRRRMWRGREVRTRVWPLLPSSTCPPHLTPFLLADLPWHTAQVLQPPSPPPLTRTWSTPHHCRRYATTTTVAIATSQLLEGCVWRGEEEVGHLAERRARSVQPHLPFQKRFQEQRLKNKKKTGFKFGVRGGQKDTREQKGVYADIYTPDVSE